MVDLISEDAALAQPLVPGMPQIRAEVVYAAREEMAVSIADVLARRIGLEFYGWREALAAARPTGELLGRELEWTSERIEQAVEEYSAIRAAARLSSPS